MRNMQRSVHTSAGSLFNHIELVISIWCMSADRVRPLVGTHHINGGGQLREQERVGKEMLELRAEEVTYSAWGGGSGGVWENRKPENPFSVRTRSGVAGGLTTELVTQICAQI